MMKEFMIMAYDKISFLAISNGRDSTGNVPFERKMGVEQTGLIDIRMLNRHNEFEHAYVGTQLEYHNITTWLNDCALGTPSCWTLFGSSLLLCSEYKF